MTTNGPVLRNIFAVAPRLWASKRSTTAAFFQEIRVATFVNEPQHVERVGFNVVVEQEGKRTAAAARETVRTDVIAALPAHHGRYGRLYPRRKILAQTR